MSYVWQCHLLLCNMSYVWQGNLLLCNMSYVRQCHLLLCNMSCFWLCHLLLCNMSYVRQCYLLASERNERDTIRGVQIRAGAVYIYIYVWRYVCHNSSACHAYVMWVELSHCHFLYVPAVLNVATTGNGTDTKMF